MIRYGRISTKSLCPNTFNKSPRKDMRQWRILTVKYYLPARGLHMPSAQNKFRKQISHLLKQPHFSRNLSMIEEQII